MTNRQKYSMLVSIIIFSTLWSASSSASNSTDPIHFMSLFERLDNFVDAFVNVSRSGNVQCKNLVIIFGDSTPETVSLVGEIVGDTNLKDKIKNVSSTLDQNFGLNLSQSLQPYLIYSNGSSSAFLSLLRPTKNFTSLEEWIADNYFIAKIRRDHFSSNVKIMSFLQFSTLVEKLGERFDLPWTKKLIWEMGLGSYIVINGTYSETAIGTYYPNVGLRHLFSKNPGIEQRFTNRQLISDVLHSFDLKQVDRSLVLLKKVDQSIKDNVEILPTHPTFVPSSPDVAMLQPILAILREMNDKFAATIFNASSDCFHEEMGIYYRTDLHPSVPSRYWGDTIPQKLLRLREKLWSLSSPLEILKLVEETLTKMPGTGRSMEKCLQTRDKLQEIERFGRFWTISKTALGRFRSTFVRFGVNIVRIFKNIEESWAIPYNKVLEHEEEFGIWYAFIHDLLRRLSSYHYQQRREWYNVKNPDDYGKPNKAQGIEITAQNLDKFADRFEFIRHDSYTKLRLDANPKRLHLVNAVLKGLLGNQLTIDCRDGIATISGNYITLSEIVKMDETECPGNYGVLNIFATSTIYVDADVTIIPKFQAINLTLIAPFVYWNAVGDCKLVVEYQSKDVIWEFSEPNNFPRVKDGSLFHAICPGAGEGTQDSEMGNDLTPISGSDFTTRSNNVQLGKILNQFKLFARSRILESIFVNLNLLEVLHSFETDVEILDFYDVAGFEDEFRLLSCHTFYQNQSTTGDLVYYLTLLSNNTNPHPERLPNLGDIEGKGLNNVTTQLQNKIGRLIIHLREHGRDKPYIDGNSVCNLDFSSTHVVRNLAVSLILLGLVSSLLFGIFVTYQKHSETVRHYFVRLSNGFRQMRN